MKWTNDSLFAIGVIIMGVLMILGLKVGHVTDQIETILATGLVGLSMGLLGKIDVEKITEALEIESKNHFKTVEKIMDEANNTSESGHDDISLGFIDEEILDQDEIILD